METRHVTDLRIDVVPMEAALDGGWFAAVRISGRVDGRPFFVLHDLRRDVHRTALAAMAAGEVEAQRRIARIRDGSEAPWSGGSA